MQKARGPRQGFRKLRVSSQLQNEGPNVTLKKRRPDKKPQQFPCGQKRQCDGPEGQQEEKSSEAQQFRCGD